jgi:hypothetical protein
MSEESTLRQKARESIAAGRLPSRHPERTWGGPGSGARCAICGECVRSNEMEFELEFERAEIDAPAPEYFQVHIRCFAAWEFERLQFEVSGNGSPRANEHSRRSAIAGGASESG